MLQQIMRDCELAQPEMNSSVNRCAAACSTMSAGHSTRSDPSPERHGGGKERLGVRLMAALVVGRIA